jgi:branched-subunit amino acid ABC-type transport system permease component
MGDLLQIVVGASTNAAIYALVAFSLVLVYRGSGVVNFGVGQLAVFPGIFFANLAGPGWISLLITILLGAGLGIVCYLIAVLPAERAGASHAALAMSTLGFGLVLTYFGGEFWLKQGFAADPLWSGSMSVAGVTITYQRLLTVLMAIVAFVLVTLLLEKTMIGWAVESVAYKRSTAGLYGVNTVVVMIFVWALAGSLAAFAGSLRSAVSAVSLGMSLPLAVLGFAAAVVGGLGSVAGAAVGAIVVSLSEALFVRYVSPDYATVFAFLLLFVMIAIRPQGIVGARREVART